jgi:hypothetical protein
MIPGQIGLTTSKVEWNGDNGISVETSLDGVTYTECTNGQAIPDYSQSSFSTDGTLYIKFTLSSSNISKHVPKLKYINFSFYKSKTVSSENFGEKVVYAEDEFHLGPANYDILSRDYRNGLRCSADAGFTIATGASVRTVEFFYTPTAFTDSGLVSSTSTNGFTASNYSWRNTGTVAKTNISAIYVNGVNKTSQTDITNVFTLGQLHHVVIVYTSTISGDIKFNYSLYGATPSLYQNVAIYESAFDSTKAAQHYSLYTARSIQVTEDSSLTLTEDGVEVYNNDWVVIQSI